MPGIIEKGVVCAVGSAGVDVKIDSAPGVGCANCGHCSVGAGGTMLMSDIADAFGVHVGDTVEVELPEGARLRTTLVSYGLPVLGLVVGYMAGFLLGNAVGAAGDDVGAITSVVAAIGTFVLARKWSTAMMGAGRFRPRVRAIISTSEEHAEE